MKNPTNEPIEYSGYCVTVDGAYVSDTFAMKPELARRRLFLNSYIPGRPLPSVEEMRTAWLAAEARGFVCAPAKLTIEASETGK